MNRSYLEAACKGSDMLMLEHSCACSLVLDTQNFCANNTRDTCSMEISMFLYCLG